MEEMPSLSQLACFVAYGHTGNFTQAAQKANITQSAFSAQIKRLETTLGITLIRRSHRGSELTPAGKEFLPKVENWLNELHQMIVDLKLKTNTNAIELNVGILSTLGDVQMNAHIAHFERENKKLRFNVFDLEDSELRAALTEGKLDVASTYLSTDEDAAGNPPNTSASDDFTIRHFSYDTMVFYAPLLSPKENLTREDLALYPMVYYVRHSLMHRLMQTYFKNMETPKPAAHLSTPYAMMMYCEQTPAGALLPDRLLRAMGRKTGWAELENPLRLDASLIYRKNSPKKNIIDIYVSHVLKSFQQNLY